MHHPRAVPLRAGDLADAAAALSRAFQDDPLQQYVLPDPGERRLRSPAHFALVLQYGLMFGEVLTTGGAPAGAAVWLGPDAWEVTPERASKAGLDGLATAIGQQGAERFLSVLGTLEPFHYRDVPRSHWYAMVVGVAPEAQGQGWGRALLQPIFDKAQASGVPCYLETAQPSNVPFYRHLGFRVMSEMTDPQSGLPLWTLRRDAQQQPAV